MENHNMSKSRIYSVWRAMKKRCYRGNDKYFKNYGGRGIKVCDEWRNSFSNFYNWSINNGYKEETLPNNKNKWTIDRIDNHGNYCPENCRWVTRDEQDKNRANNFVVEFKGKNYTISELSNMCDIDRTTLYERIAFLGWDIEDAMTRPIKIIKGKRKEFMDKYYLIRDRKSGCYLVKGREWTKDVELATRYKSKKLAERSISNSYLMVSMDCEVVELPSRAEIFADLEAKLAEKENTIINLIEDNNASKELLKKQLAEKEKELHYKTAECEKWEADYENCSKLEKMITKERQYCLDNWIASDQDKISFAIEQITKTKETLIKFLKDEGFYENEWYDLFEKIDNQIKQLKEGR